MAAIRAVLISQLVAGTLILLVLVAQFASGLAAQASASPCCTRWAATPYCPRGVFGWLSEKFHTQVANLVNTAVVGLIAIFLDVATSTSFINFGAFTAFTLVNAAVVFHHVRQRRVGQQLNSVSCWWPRWTA